MSMLAQRPATVPGSADAALAHAGRTFFLLGQNARGLWVIRQSTGAKAGMFLSREAAIKFARLESADEQFAVIDVPGGLEFDYAA
jgi:hypothetical protein